MRVTRQQPSGWYLYAVVTPRRPRTRAAQRALIIGNRRAALRAIAEEASHV